MQALPPKVLDRALEIRRLEEVDIFTAKKRAVREDRLRRLSELAARLHGCYPEPPGVREMTALLWEIVSDDAQ